MFAQVANGFTFTSGGYQPLKSLHGNLLTCPVPVEKDDMSQAALCNIQNYPHFFVMQVFRPNDSVLLTASHLPMHRGDIREAKADINARVKLDGEPHFCPLHVPWKWRNSWSFLKGHFWKSRVNILFFTSSKSLSNDLISHLRIFRLLNIRKMKFWDLRSSEFQQHRRCFEHWFSH